MDSKYAEDDGCKSADSDEEYLPGASIPDYLGRAVAFYQSRPFHGPLDEFVQRHAHEFSDAAEAKSGEHVEHSLSYSDLHAEYLAIFENLLQDFLAEDGCSPVIFYQQCQDALEDKFAALFEAHEHHWFVDALMASFDYAHFFARMCDECRRQEREQPSQRK